MMPRVHGVKLERILLNSTFEQPRSQVNLVWAIRPDVTRSSLSFIHDLTELDQALASLQMSAAVHRDQITKTEPFAIR